MNLLRLVSTVFLLFITDTIATRQIEYELIENSLVRYYDQLDCYQEEQMYRLNEFNKETFNTQLDFITVSLGFNCDPGLNTRKYNIRSFAFPFDWCLTPFKALCNFIESDFKNFFKLEHLVPASMKYFTPEMLKFFKKNNQDNVSQSSMWVLDKETGMIFNHDFNSNSLNFIKSHFNVQKNKYQRRIDRLYQIINSGKYIYFIRSNDISKNKAIKLLNLLKSKFPQTPFTLIVASSKADFSTEWNIPHLKNYHYTNLTMWETICADIVSGKLKSFMV